MGHLEIDSLRKYLLHLGVSYIDDITAKPYYDTCQLAKAIKQYNRTSRPHAMVKYLEIYTDLVGLIMSHGFQNEKYIITFTDSSIQKTESFTRSEKQK